MTRSWSERITARSTWWSVAVVGLILFFTLLAMPRQGLWIVDNENRFLQAQALVDSDFSTYAIPWRGQPLDPDLSLNPLRFNPEGSFQEDKNGQLISVFQPAFIVISAGLFQVMGHWGLYVLPLGAAILLLLGVARLAAVLYSNQLAAHLAVFLTGLATPVWFYSQAFWEHTTAACLCVWGLVYVTRFLKDGRWRDLAAGFAFLVSAVFLRDVLGIFALLVLGLILVRERSRWFRILLTAGAVMAAGVGLLMIFQWYTTGQPLGFHAGTLVGSEGGIMAHLRERPRLFFLFFSAALPDRAWSLVLAAPFLVAFVLRPRLPQKNTADRASWWALAALVSGAIFLYAFFTAANPMRHLLISNSFFFASPILVLGLLRDKQKETFLGSLTGGGFLLAAFCLYLLAYSFMAPWAGAVSLHWGARPVFALYPILAVPAAGNLARWFAAGGSGALRRSVIIGLLILVSVAGQVGSIDLLNKKKAFSVRLAETAAGFSGPVIVTNVWWLGHELHSVFFDKAIFYVRTQEELQKLEVGLRAQNVREFLFVTRPHPGPVQPGELRIDDGGWNFYSLDVRRAMVSDPPD
jgi:hypothetical protein